MIIHNNNPAVFYILHLSNEGMWTLDLGVGGCEPMILGKSSFTLQTHNGMVGLLYMAPTYKNVVLDGEKIVLVLQWFAPRTSCRVKDFLKILSVSYLTPLWCMPLCTTCCSWCTWLHHLRLRLSFTEIIFVDYAIKTTTVDLTSLHTMTTLLGTLQKRSWT